jgi:hypothetical protein
MLMRLPLVFCNSAILEVLMKVKLHCTNCQSLVRLSPVFSALGLRTPIQPGRSLIATVSDRPRLGGRAPGTLFLRIRSLEKQSWRHLYRPTLGRTSIYMREIWLGAHLKFAGKLFNKD